MWKGALLFVKIISSASKCVMSFNFACSCVRELRMFYCSNIIVTLVLVKNNWVKNTIFSTENRWKNCVLTNCFKIVKKWIKLGGKGSKWLLSPQFLINACDSTIDRSLKPLFELNLQWLFAFYALAIHDILVDERLGIDDTRSQTNWLHQRIERILWVFEGISADTNYTRSLLWLRFVHYGNNFTVNSNSE